MSDKPKTGQNVPKPDTPRKGAADAAAVALASGLTVKDAAKQAGVGERTVRRWMGRPKFKARVNQLRGEVVGAAVNRLSRSMTDSADVLAKLLKSRSEATRMRAARSILELATRLRESEELEARVNELERQFAKGDKS